MKQFRLISVLLLFVLLLTCFINIFFYRINIRETKARREARIQNLANVYTDEFQKMGLLVRHLNNNRLVNDLRYERVPDAKKYLSLISALSLIESSYSKNVQMFVYFHDSDTIVSSRGKMQPELLEDDFLLSADFDFLQFREDDSKDIQILPGIGLYLNTNYSLRKLSDWGTIYVYTEDHVSVLAVSNNAPLDAMLWVAVQDTDNEFLIWDNADQRVILGSDETLLGIQGEDPEALLQKAWPQDGERILCRQDRGRFVYLMVEHAKADMLSSLRINVFLLATVIIGLLFVLFYYMVLRREVFLPLKSILKKLPIATQNENEYGAIEEALFSMQSRIESLSQSLQNAAAQEQESRLRQALLGTENQELSFYGEGTWFVIVSLMGETDAPLCAVGEWMRQRFQGRMIANMWEQMVYLICFDGKEACDAFKREVRQISERGFAMGVSRAYADFSHIREAYLESCDVIHAIADGERAMPILFFAGDDETDDSVSVPMNSRDVGMLLSTIANGDVDSATQLVAEMLDSESARTIAQYRYRSTYMLNVLSMAQNMQKEAVFSLTMQTTRIRSMISEQTMRKIVLDTCGLLTQTFSTTKEDALIQFIRKYVETHYAENIYLKTIAEETGFSYAYISHYFSEHQGIGFADYLNSIRVEKACEMLRDVRLTLNEIAENVGYGSMNTFVRNMKKFTGMTPDAYRKSHAED